MSVDATGRVYVCWYFVDTPLLVPRACRLMRIEFAHRNALYPPHTRTLSSLPHSLRHRDLAPNQSHLTLTVSPVISNARPLTRSADVPCCLQIAMLTSDLDDERAARAKTQIDVDRLKKLSEM